MVQINFHPVTEAELPDFKKRLQAAFDLAAKAELNSVQGQPVVPDIDIEQNYRNPGAETYNLFAGNNQVGGVILTIDTRGKHNHLDFFFIDSAFRNKGYGYAAWKAVEERYPHTLVWHTGTPYFEKRNIHFYVNKCGFKINAFYCKAFSGSQCPSEEYSNKNGMEEGFFDFEKVMQPAKKAHFPTG